MAMLKEMANRVKSLFLGLFLTFLITSNSYADVFARAWKNNSQTSGQFILEPSITYYSTQSNFDAEGSNSTPSGFSRLDRQQLNVEATLGLTDRLSAFGTAAWARIVLENSTNPGEIFGFTDQNLGLNYRVIGQGNSFSLHIQTLFDFPLYNNGTSTQKSIPFLGDQTNDFTTGLFAAVPLSNDNSTWKLAGGMGYKLRSGNFSPAVPWSAWLTNERVKGVNFLLGAYGINSIRSELATTNTCPSASNGGSCIVSSPSPSLANIHGQIGYSFNHKATLALDGAYPFYGKGAPNGFLAGIILKLNLSSPEKGEEAVESAHASGTKGFLNYTTSANVIRANDRLNLIKIDKGSNDGVETGQIWDIFSVKPDGTISETVARARVTKVRSSEAALVTVEYFKEVWIEEGFIAKRLLQ